MKIVLNDSNYLIASIIITLAITVLYAIPVTLILSHYPVCLHYEIFKVQCPLCGMVRAVYFFLHGQFRMAWQMNFNVFLMAPLYPLIVVKIFTNKPWIRIALRIISWILIGGFVCIYLIRILTETFS